MVERAFDRVTIQIKQLYEALKGKGAGRPDDWKAALTIGLYALKTDLTKSLPEISIMPPRSISRGVI
jgi:hypothetical protein